MIRTFPIVCASCETVGNGPLLNIAAGGPLELFPIAPHDRIAFGVAIFVDFDREDVGSTLKLNVEIAQVLDNRELRRVPVRCVELPNPEPIVNIGTLIKLDVPGGGEFGGRTTASYNLYFDQVPPTGWYAVLVSVNDSRSSSTLFGIASS